MQGRRLGNWIKQRQDQTIDYTEPPPEEQQAGEAWEPDPHVLRLQRRQRVRWIAITTVAVLMVVTGGFLLIRSATGYQRVVRAAFNNRNISYIEYQPFLNSAFIKVEDPSLIMAIRDWLAESEPQDSLSRFGAPTCQLKVVYADGTTRTIMIDPTGPSLGPDDTIVPPSTLVPIEVDGYKRWAYAASLHGAVYARLPVERQLARSSLPATMVVPGRAFAAVMGTPTMEDRIPPYDSAMDLAKQLVKAECYGQATLALKEALRLMPESVDATELSAIVRSNLNFQAPRLRDQLAAVLNESTDRFGTRAGYHQVRLDLLKIAWMFPPDDTEMAPLRGRLAQRRPSADLTKFQEIWRLEGGPADLYPVRSLLWSPDATRIAAACTDPFIRIWDGTNGRLLGRVPTKGPSESLAFSADGRYLLAGGHDLTEISRASQVWDVVTCEPAMTDSDQPIAPASFFHPDGVIATTTPDGDVELRDSRTQEVLKTLGGHVGSVRLARFSADGDVLLTLGEDGMAIGWGDGPVDQSTPLEENRYRSLRRLATLPGPGVFTKDGKIIVVRREGAAVDGMPASLALMPVDLKDSIREMAVSADGKLLLLVTEAGEAVVTDVQKGTEQQRYRPPDGSTGVGISADGKLVAYGAADGSVRVVNVASGSEVGLTSTLTGRNWAFIRFSGDGRLVLARDGDACAVWEVANATNWFRTDRLSSGDAEATPAALSGNGKLLAVARRGDAFEIISTDTFDSSVHVQRSAVTSLEFSGDGRLLAAADPAGVITIHDTSSGGAMQTMRLVAAESSGGTGTVRGMLFGSDGNTLLVEAGDGSVRLFDVTRGVELRRLVLPAGMGSVRTLSFSPDMKRVLAGTVLWGTAD